MRVRTAQPDRRAHLRGVTGAEPTRPRLVSLILGSYHQMPGLSLHLNQAARLFGLRPSTCEAVLRDLLADGQLRRAEDGQYLIGDRNIVDQASLSAQDRYREAISRRGR